MILNVWINSQQNYIHCNGKTIYLIYKGVLLQPTQYADILSSILLSD